MRKHNKTIYLVLFCSIKKDQRIFDKLYISLIFDKTRYFIMSTLIWVGFLVVRLPVEGVKANLCLKIVRIMLEFEIWYVNKDTYVVSENIPFSTMIPLILLISAFSAKKISIFLAKIEPLLQEIVWELC